MQSTASKGNQATTHAGSTSGTATMATSAASVSSDQKSGSSISRANFFSQLPDDVLLNIYSYFDILDDKANFSATSAATRPLLSKEYSKASKKDVYLAKTNRVKRLKAEAEAKKRSEKMLAENKYIKIALDESLIAPKDLRKSATNPASELVANQIFSEKGLEGLRRGLFTFNEILEYGWSEHIKFIMTPMHDRTLAQILSDTGFKLLTEELIDIKKSDGETIEGNAAFFMMVKEGFLKLNEDDAPNAPRKSF